MQSTLLRASAVFVRSTARRLTLASQRACSGSTGGSASMLHASRKTLMLAGGITFVACSTTIFVYSRASAKEVSEEKKSAAVRLLECYGLDGDTLSTFQHFMVHAAEKFVQDCELRSCDSIEKKIAAAESVLRYLDAESKKDHILADVKEYLEKKWKQGTEEEYLINDAIHGSIELTPLLFQIINTPEFHRLKDVRQLGAAHYVYPGANHTRFDHSVGVCHLAGVFAKSLKGKLERDEAILDNGIQKRKLYTFDDHEVLCVKIAGLCHDLGHGPLSHMFEHKVVKYLKLKDVKDHKKCKHEVLSVDIFKRMLVENPKVLAEFVDEGLTHKHVQLIGEMINPPTDANDRLFPKRIFLYEIVANKTTGIDVDKWDYYARDCHYLGVEQDFQWRRCMLLARVVLTPKGYKEEGKLRIAFREKEHENLYGMFKTRAVLHQKAYQHKTVKAVEKMIADAFLKVQDVYMIRVDSESEGSDRLLSKSIKEVVELAFHRNSEKVDLKWYMALSDSLISTIQCTDGKSADQWNQLHEAQQLLTRVKRRDLYSCSVRIPISINANRCENHLSETKIECKECKKDYALVKVAESLRSEDKMKQFQQDICRDLEHIKAEDIWIEVVEFKLSSEGDGDPVKKVLFYRKPALQTLPEAISSKDIKKTSKLVIPQAFVEYELRVYDKRKKVNRAPDDKRKLEKATEEVLKEWQQKKV